MQEYVLYKIGRDVIGRLVYVIIILFLLSCGEDGSNFRRFSRENSDEFFQGIIRGHEDITRWAIKFANRDIGVNLKNFLYRFPVVKYETHGNSSHHLIIRGNYATDNTTEVKEFSLNKYYGAPLSLNMANDGNYQVQHFLRNYGESDYMDAYESCRTSVSLIRRATHEVINNWEKSNDRALFFIGHALHIIQDSFSKAHTRRSKNFRKIKNICIYNKDYPGVCKHHFIDFNDYVFHLFCHRKAWDCLKDEAKAAAKASSAYLYSIALHLSNPIKFPLDLIINKYLTDPKFLDKGTGYFKCDTLMNL